jgi:AAA ATPase domain
LKVTARVQRQVAGLFVAEERGTHTLKGVPERAALFRLVRVSGGGRRSGQRNLTPLVGRDDETAMLIRRWERARQGDGQLALIVGEPGLGKSRLIEEFHPASATCRTPGSNGAVRSFCRTRRCIRSPNGAVSASAAPMFRLRSGSPNWKVRWRGQARHGGKHPLARAAPRHSVAAGTRDSFCARGLRRRQLAALTNWLMAGAKTQLLATLLLTSEISLAAGGGAGVERVILPGNSSVTHETPEQARFVAPAPSGLHERI